MILAQLLLQFAFRVTFGLTLAMAILPAGLVTPGFFRVHLWVLMGLNTLAGLVFYSQRGPFEETLSQANLLLCLSVALPVLCYVASVVWLYERREVGRLLLLTIAFLSLAAATFATPLRETASLGVVLAVADLISSGLLLGMTLAAMFLGHWYLNTPTMQLSPLKLLVILMATAVIVRALVSGTGLTLQATAKEAIDPVFWIFVSFRWLTGILAALIFALMAWYTLKVPNTQSATGILYAGVVVTFLGELMSQLLSVHSLYPV